MAIIDLKLKTYEQLQNEVIMLNTNSYLKDLVIEDLQERIFKTIEYIKDKQELNKMFKTITLSKDSQNELLNILKGDDTKVGD